VLQFKKMLSRLFHVVSRFNRFTLSETGRCNWRFIVLTWRIWWTGDACSPRDSSCWAVLKVLLKAYSNFGKDDTKGQISHSLIRTSDTRRKLRAHHTIQIIGWRKINLFVARPRLFVVWSFPLRHVSIVVSSMHLYSILISFGTILVFAKCTCTICEVLKDKLRDLELFLCQSRPYWMFEVRASSVMGQLPQINKGEMPYHRIHVHMLIWREIVMYILSDVRWRPE
jgi:hypothetical protein